jgi:hypothetical protein
MLDLRRGAALTLTLAAVTVPGVAQAADTRAGEVSDPAGDATLATSLVDPPARLLDVRAVDVQFDATAGTLIVALGGDSLTGQHRESLHASLRLGPLTGSGVCDATARADDVRIEASAGGGTTGGDTFPLVQLLDAGGTLLTTGTWTGATETGFGGPRFIVTAASLRGRALRCVRPVTVTKGVAEYLTASTDRTVSFPLSGVSGTAPPLVSLNGETLTWAAVGGATSYVTATSTAAEGSLSRTTTYTTVNGTSWTPPAFFSGQRFYSVRVNVPGSRWSRLEVQRTAAVPFISATGTTLSWTAVRGAPGYVLATSTAPRGATGRTTT